jgi:tetratricopeptide (TPR) repeat protein
MERFRVQALAIFVAVGLAAAANAAIAAQIPEQLDRDLGKLEGIAGSFPTLAETPEQRAEAEALWHSLETRLLQVLQASPHDFEAELRLGDLYRMGHNLDIEGSWDKAVIHLKEAARLQPDSPAPLMRLGAHYAASGHAAEAEPVLLRAVALSGGKPASATLFYLLFTDYQLGQFEKVVSYANELLKEVPDWPAVKFYKERAEAALRGEFKPKTIQIEPKTIHIERDPPTNRADETTATAQKVADSLHLAETSFDIYYLDPRPDRIPSLLAEMQKQGMLALGHMTAAGFLSQVIHDNPDRLKAWVPLIWKLDDSEREYLWLTLWFSGIEPAMEPLREAGSKESGKVAESIASIAKGKPAPPLTTFPVDSGETLDLLWGAFYATGRTEYVARIIDSLPESLKSKPEDAKQKAVGMTAEWSLRQNARKHPRILAFCKSELERRDEDTRKILSKLILEAEKGDEPPVQ